MAVLRRKGRRLVLIDENLSPPLKIAVLRLNPNIDILRIGDAEGGPIGGLFWVRPNTTLGELAKIKGNLSHFPATNGIIPPN